MGLGEFYKEIDSREGFCQGILEKDSGLELEQQLVKEDHHAAKADSNTIYLDLELAKGPAEPDPGKRENEYGNDRRSS